MKNGKKLNWFEASAMAQAELQSYVDRVVSRIWLVQTSNGQVEVVSKAKAAIGG